MVRALPSREEGLCHCFCPEGLRRPPKLPPPLPLPEASRFGGRLAARGCSWSGAGGQPRLGGSSARDRALQRTWGPAAGLRAGGPLGPAPVPQRRAARSPQRLPGLSKAPGRQGRRGCALGDSRRVLVEKIGGYLACRGFHKSEYTSLK